jgi:hypothetical protein
MTAMTSSVVRPSSAKSFQIELSMAGNLGRRPHAGSAPRHIPDVNLH